jgi:hypothetical protein
MDLDLFPGAAEHCARVVLGNLDRRFPYSAHHTQRSSEDRPSPAEIHPAFHTSFDWHSCVHMHWLGASVLNHAGTEKLRTALSENLTAEKLAAEADYLEANPTWERPYGWAWLMRLAAACSTANDDELRGWGANLERCVDVVARLVPAWLAKVEYPVRHGIHANSAFGVALLLDAFRVLGRAEAAGACEAAALRWFGEDTDWPADWELSGQDFLSAGLSEADLMQRVLTPDEFAAWFGRFLPSLGSESRILTPVGVPDESDGYMVHLHGLNLSRAGQLARIARALRRASSPSSAEPVLAAAIEPLLRAGIAALDSEDFMSTHWLASFAWDAVTSV